MKLLFSFLFIAGFNFLVGQIPRPKHVVIVFFENKDYSQVAGSSNAPFINSLLVDTNAAVFTQFYSHTHPSQPNYLILYSGSDQGVKTDDVPKNTPFVTCNLGASLIQKGFTFAGYCESMPAEGYLGKNTSVYVRRHNPWSNWQGQRTNNISPSSNLPFSKFPTNYDELPDVSFVIPDLQNSMHDGSLKKGDAWLKAQLNDYLQWAKTNNSLLILTFDEDGGSEGNRIMTFFYGPMIKGGSYDAKLNHHNILRTLEEIYGLPLCGNSSYYAPIDFVWKNASATSWSVSTPQNGLDFYPVPVTEDLTLVINSAVPIADVDISLSDLYGRKTFSMSVDLEEGENTFVAALDHLLSGVYILKISGKEVRFNRKLLIE